MDLGGNPGKVLRTLDIFTRNKITVKLQGTKSREGR
jgi:hypothetical protein